jgi:hypothetical protein
VFAVLIYTDCAAEDSVSGRSGFQFQAESLGATPTDEDRIRNGLLHVVPVGVAADVPESHPPTCAYAALDGRYYLSRGRSTGQTLSGRPGNQVTETIVTGSPSDILPLRPAQLFSAPLWTLSAAPGTEVAVWEAPLEIDPEFETSELHRMVLSDRWLSGLLPSFLTMVEQAGGSPQVKLILAHSDQVVVMRWIALASLFEDGTKALDLSFRVFSANPVSETAHIVGAHPFLSPGLTPDGVSGCNLVDLEQRMVTPVPVSSSAAMHASWFLDYDPYEALDAIETSRRWAGLFAPEVAARAAELACLAVEGTTPDYQQVVAALVALSALAECGAHDELEAYGDQILDSIVARAPQPADDITLLTRALWNLHAANEDDLATAVALVGLEWAVLAPRAAEMWAESHELPRVASEERLLNWSDPEAAEHGANLVNGVLTRASAGILPRWLSLANALGTGLTVEQARPQIERMARHWSSHPELTPTAYTWLHVDQVTACLQNELCERFESGDRDALLALDRGQWDWLIGKDFVVDPNTRPLSAWLAARIIDGQPLNVRMEILRRVAPIVPSWASALFLERRSSPTEADEIVTWLRRNGQLSPGFADFVDDHVTRHLNAGRLGPFLRVLDALQENDATGLTPGLTRTLSGRENMNAALAEAQRLETEERNAGLAALSTYPANWLVLYADLVAERVLAAADEDAIIALADKLGGRLDAAVGRAVSGFAERGDLRALTGTLRLLEIDPEGLGRRAQQALAAVWDEPRWEMDRHRMLQQLPQAWDPLLKEFENSLGRRRRTWSVIRGARRILDTKDGQ